MATKLDRMIASLDGLLPIMSHDPLITWPCEIGGSLTGGGSVRKRLSRNRLLVFLQILYSLFLRNIYRGQPSQVLVFFSRATFTSFVSLS